MDASQLEQQQLRNKQNLFKLKQCGENTKKCWDLFYKRNANRFFKDRHWTIREFEQLIVRLRNGVILEIGCGCGNFLWPLLDTYGTVFRKFYACDISTEAIRLLKSNEKFDSNLIEAFEMDISQIELDHSKLEKIDLISLIFVLSAIDPAKFSQVFRNLNRLLRAGGLVVLRDYADGDAAMVRFKNDRQWKDGCFVRQDGTLSYFFKLDELRTLFESNGFEIEQAEIIERRTINVKEDIDLERKFVQIIAKKIRNLD